MSLQLRDLLRHRRRQIVLLPRVGLEVEEEVVVVVARVDRFAAADRELELPAALAIGTETAVVLTVVEVAQLAVRVA